MSRRGFAWYELVFVLTAIGSAMALAGPVMETRGRQGIATQVLADVDSVRSAAFRFYSDSGYFPRQVGFGGIPEGLVPYLPAGFSFRRNYGTIDYRNWVLSTSYSTVAAKNVIGVSLVAKDPKVGAAAMARYGERPKLTVGSTRVFLVFGG
jgi:hypothetical protein